jgi:hypothetical protein
MSGYSKPTPPQKIRKPLPVPVNSSEGAEFPQMCLEFSVTVWTKGRTAADPTIRISSRASAIPTPSQKTTPTKNKRIAISNTPMLFKTSGCDNEDQKISRKFKIKKSH